MKKVLMIIGGIVVALVLVGVIVFVVISMTSKKLECKSDVGNITLMYSDKTVTGYAASGIEYDLTGQQKIADKIGIEAYLDEFEDWFEENTDGTCARKLF